MKAYEDMCKTIRELECELESLDDCYDIAKLDKIEMRTVRILQLLEVQIGGIGSELYAAVKQRRARINMGEFSGVEAPLTEEEKPVEAPKKTRKKSTKKSK